MKFANRINRNGFTIIELLMALVIMATLMAAVGLAFDASVKNYQANEGIYKTLNTARQALLRMTTDLRTANIVATEADDSPDQNSQISLITSNGDDITYRFDSSDNTLYYVDNSTGSSYTLCKNVTAMTLNRTIVPGSSPVDIRSVRIILTVTDDIDNPKVTQTLATGTVVRKNQ
ncbi:MAG: prepilin-type N-terminal cleavage/methylation domain-containing protein [Planctomycetes bacterium]|nr:prepilin-type N-terminal cleavage/methylation domain-containing protein [Planctomycetota bacterium]